MNVIFSKVNSNDPLRTLAAIINYPSKTDGIRYGENRELTDDTFIHNINMQMSNGKVFSISMENYHYFMHPNVITTNPDKFAQEIEEAYNAGREFTNSYYIGLHDLSEIDIQAEHEDPYNSAEFTYAVFIEAAEQRFKEIQNHIKESL